MKKVFFWITLLSIFLCTACTKNAGSTATSTSGSSITVPSVSNTNIVTSVDSDDVVDGLDYDAYGKTDLVVLNCQEKYFVKLDGNAGWYSLVGGLPDGIIVEDGEFASMTADVKLISGGIAGYIQQPQISKVYSYKTVSFDGVLDNGDVPDYNQGQSFAGPRFYETDGHKYLVVKLSYGDFYIYENGELKEHYDTAFETEAYLGIIENADENADLEETRVAEIYVIRCGDQYLASPVVVENTQYPTWKLILNENYENVLEDIELKDGEMAYIHDARVLVVNGGEKNYVNAPMLKSYESISKCRYDECTHIEHWEESAPERFGEVRQFYSGQYLIFNIGGKYNVYRDTDWKGTDQGLVGIYDTKEEVDAALGRAGSEQSED